MQTNSDGISIRHRVLIAAAVAAVVQNARIREIKPAGWTRRRPAGECRVRDYRLQMARCEAAPEIEVATEEEEVG
jgi:hypothetical protein